ncbi:SOS response-associated peptidase [Fulvivirgaceae bacterium BMA10]|uniref:Abasic site processing protein n=1 Tax=Splendidivirga corallicola TaxID=3051826 RepID=A0ABT8KS23_9BACT|nr:SOS response-associated peptidase [Fulvivirgaceae bacterium BMA10]
MPERYSISTKAGKLQERFKVEVTEDYQQRYNAAPSQLLPVITNHQPDRLSFMYWGVEPSWSKNKTISTKLINSEAESIQEKISLQSALAQRRCVIPADGFFDWKKISKKSKVPYRFIMSDGEPFSFAGIWEQYEDVDNNQIVTFKVITVQANGLVGEINPRMPAILTPETEKIWLGKNESIHELLEVLQPLSSDKMVKYTVSPFVNSIDNDFPEVLNAAPAADQFGNYSLFD